MGIGLDFWLEKLEVGRFSRPARIGMREASLTKKKFFYFAQILWT